METRESGVALYAEPREVTSLDVCHFYHTMEIPGYGVVPGPWDHRRAVDAYLGNVDLSGKRVLEVGTASGFFCFEMERRGADVVSYDLSDDYSWDVVPYARYDHAAYDGSRREHLRQINNAWWLAHRAHASNAKVVYGTVYEVPGEIGHVDVATFGNVLLHVRDPFRALESALRLTTETAIVTGEPSFRYSLPQMAIDLFKPSLAFLPNPEKTQPRDTWWHFRPAVIRRMLGVLGFEKTKVTYHLGHRYEGRPTLLFTVVGHRTVPQFPA